MEQTTKASRVVRFVVAIVLCLAGFAFAEDNRRGQSPADSSRLHRSTRTSGSIDLSHKDNDRVYLAAVDHYLAGLIDEEEGNLTNAADHYLAALGIYPESYEVRFSLGKTYFKMRRFSDVLDALVPARNKDVQGYGLLADACRGLGLDDSACAFYLKVIELDPDNSAAYSYLAGYYRLAGNIDSTIWAYNHLAHMQPDNYRIFQEIAKLYAQTKRTDSAKAALFKSLAIQSNATNMLAYLGLAQLYAEDSLLDSARFYLTAGLSQEPDNLMVLRELLNVCVRLDSLHNALSCAKAISRLTPLDVQSKRREAILYFGCDSLSQADSIWAHIIARGEGTTQDVHYRGRIAVVRNDFDSAEKFFAEVTKLADSLPQSWLDLAFVYRSKHEGGKEIAAIQSGLNHMRDDSSSIRLLFALGVAYDQSGKLDSAVQVFEELIARNPHHDQALNYLGYMFADRGERLDYAEELIFRALSIAPDNAAYIDSYGWVKFRKGLFKEAVIQLKRAVALADDPTIFDHLGDAYQAQGDSAEARRCWQKALELSPDNTAIKNKMSR